MGTLRSVDGPRSLRVARVLCLVGASLAAGCLTPGATSPPETRATESPIPSPGGTDHVSAPQWKTGDRWVIQWQNPRGSGTTVWTVDREETVEGVEHYVIASGPWTSFWTKPDLAFHADQYAGVTVTLYDPPQARYVWPLFPGKTWTQTYRRDDRRQDAITEVTMACRVESAESVAVPAGTFAALKIVCRNQGTDAIIHETWYAPAVKSWVRERGRFAFGIQERALVAFERVTPSAVVRRRVPPHFGLDHVPPRLGP